MNRNNGICNIDNVIADLNYGDCKKVHELYNMNAVCILLTFNVFKIRNNILLPKKYQF